MSSSRYSYFLFLFLLAGCVVTPHGGPGTPPAVPLPPAPVGSDQPDATTTEADLVSEIRARHILVAYEGAERSEPGIARTKEEALKRAKEALKRARAGEPFEKLVEEYSDEPGAALRGGDLGTFRRGQMVKAFSEAAFGLEPGELSEVVETEFGYHVIQRTE